MTQNDLTTFLRIIPPDNRTWQTFDDKRLDTGQPRRSRRLARVLAGPLASIEPALRRLNAPDVGAGVYITGHLTDGFGRRTRNITRIAAVVADMDNGLPFSFPLAPTIIVETSPGKFQCWWVLADADAFTVAEHRDVLAHLVHDFGADPRATGIARVYRVPGFWHLKRTPFLVRVVGGVMKPVDKAALLAAFPPLPSPRPSREPLRTMPPRGGNFSNSGLDRFAVPLAAIPADDYGLWITIGLALHAESGGGTDGLAIWETWSAGSSKYWPGACAGRWARFKPSTGSLATGGKIFWLAARYGWRASSRPSC
jgi:Primase C terminal 2 (PriCT-2)/RepB DNA-primase from phage plasmid